MSIHGMTITTEYFLIAATVSTILFLVAAASAFKSIHDRRSTKWIDENCDIFEFSNTLNSNHPEELNSLYNSGIRKATITTCEDEIVISVEMPHRTIFKKINKHLYNIDYKFFKNYLAVKLELEQVSSATKSYAIINVSKPMVKGLTPNEIAQLICECLNYSIPQENIKDNYWLPNN